MKGCAFVSWLTTLVPQVFPPSLLLHNGELFSAELREHGRCLSAPSHCIRTIGIVFPKLCLTALVARQWSDPGEQRGCNHHTKEGMILCLCHACLSVLNAHTQSLEKTHSIFLRNSKQNQYFLSMKAALLYV